jgi:hypothetical protein
MKKYNNLNTQLNYIYLDSLLASAALEQACLVSIAFFRVLCFIYFIKNSKVLVQYS